MLAPVRVVLVGPPGSGKGTQGQVIAPRLGVPYLSTGEVLRAQIAADTPLGRRVADLVDRGELVPDDLMVAVVAAALGDHPDGGGYVLDGFPRTLPQAEAIDRADSPLGTPEVVVHLTVPDRVVQQRLARRAQLDGRADDADPAVTDRRLRLYQEETEPLLDHYRRRGILVTVEGDRAPDEVTAATMAAIEVHQRGV
jgi:adenylate kinase